MATRTLAANVEQAIGDLSLVKTAIGGMGVTVPAHTPTSQYGALAADGFLGLLSSDADDQPSSLTVTVAGNIRGYGFSQMQGLNEITLTIGETVLGTGVFYGCTNLETVTLSSTAAGGITELGSNLFFNCANLKNFTIPQTVNMIKGQAFGGCRLLEVSSVPSGVTAIPTSCFSNCTAITSFTVHGGVTSIASNAFSGCTNLTTITVEGPEGSIDGYETAWGAPNATVVWTG